MIYNRGRYAISAPVEPNPLEGELSVTNIPYYDDVFAFPITVFDGTHLWTWIYESSKCEQAYVSKMDLSGENLVKYPVIDGLNGNELTGFRTTDHAMCCVYHENQIWWFFAGSRYVVKVDVYTGKMISYTTQDGVNGNVNSDLGGHNTSRAVYADGFLWSLCYHTTGDKLIRVDMQTGTMTGYDLPCSSCTALSFDGEYLWAGPGYLIGTQAPVKLFKISLPDITVEEVPWPEDVQYSVWSQDTCFSSDGQFLWFFPNGKQALKLNPQDHTWEIVTQISGELTGQDVAYDGKYMWMEAGGDLRKFNPTTGELTVFRYNALGIVNVWYQILYDGASLWMISHNGNYVRIDGASGRRMQITERYINSLDDTPAQPDTTMELEPGDDYIRVAPKLEGWKRVGHQVDGGEHQITRTAALFDVQEDHTVTFLYEPCDGEHCVDPELYTIRESYFDMESETFIRPDTYTYVFEGEDYVKVAPKLAGYRRMGHILDDGEWLITRTVVIFDVQGNHHVIFLYEPCDGDNCVDPEDGGPGGPGTGGGTDPGDGGGTDPGDGGGTDPGDGGGTDPGDGGGTDPGDGGGTDPGDGGGTDPGDGGGTDPGDGGGTDPGDGGGTDPGDGGGADPGDGGNSNGGNKGKRCCCCQPCMPMMPMMCMPVMMMPCMPMTGCMPYHAQNNCCCFCNCKDKGGDKKPDPGTTLPNEDDEDDCE